MSIKYVFDLDNTIIYTDYLNYESYKFALVEYLDHEALLKLPKNKRITREYIYTNFSYLGLTDADYTKIINKKQNYFIKHIEKTSPNLKLIKFLNLQKKEDCILWTSSNKERALSILEYYNLEDAFLTKIFSNKANIEKDILNITEKFCCDKKNLLIFEDDIKNIEKLKYLSVKVEINKIKDLD